MPPAITLRSEPSGRNDTTAAELDNVGAHESHGEEMPTRMRPSGPRASPLISPTSAGNCTTTVLDANVVPPDESNSRYASTRSFDATYSASWYQSSPSGVCAPAMTFTGWPVPLLGIR